MDDPVTHLAWICPSAASLTALARRGVVAAWEEVRTDPGAVLLIVSSSSECHSLPALLPAVADGRAVLERALHLLDRSGSNFVDWDHPRLRPLYQSALATAALAQRIADRTACCDPENAWTAGLLAPLGRMAVCVGRPSRAAASPPVRSDRLARRLARRWGLPAWLTTVVGHLTLPADAVQVLGADLALFRVVQLAAALVAEQDAQAFLDTGGISLRTAAAALGLSAEIDTLTGEAHELMHQPLPLREWIPPQQVPMLRDLLHLAVENHQLRDDPLSRRLEDDLDAFHDFVEKRRSTDEQTLRVQKLRSLAEFAAGAGHEINNPLAVISGQSQYLLQRLTNKSSTEPIEPENDPLPPETLRRSLTTIVQQAQHIHQILRGLMQFARPARPQKQSVDLVGIVHEVVASLRDFAVSRSVTVDSLAPTHSAVLIEADPIQLRTALSCLLRNALEAAPVGGWARVRVTTPDRGGSIEILVEDSGPGPDIAAREHLFDPFFSGRQAGRGCGLGLPTAWALAQQHGGDVRLVSPPGEPTRFVLSLPHTLQRSEAA